MQRNRLATPTWLLSGVMVCVGLTALAEPVKTAQEPLPILVGRGDDLLAAKQRYDAGDSATTKAVDKLVREAQKALDKPIVAVTEKAPHRVATSGDPHDYVSLSPYWWPNPDTADGMPFIKKDGQYNPDRALYDEPRMTILYKTVRPLALAYYFTGDERYAQNAAERLRTWFLDDATRMNPNLKYAQFKPGHGKFNHWGIIETNRLAYIPNASMMLRGSPHWNDADDAALKDWFAAYLDWLTTSALGQEELAAPNNHGSWANAQVVQYALFTGQNDVAKHYLETIPQRIASQIEPDGSQPEEIRRTRALHYTDFNLRALISLAEFGDRVGVDLWHYETEDGRSLRKAIDFAVPFMIDPASFPYKQIDKPKYKNFAQTLRRAAIGYHEPAYEQAAQQLNEPLSPTSWVNLLMAPVTCDQQD